MATAKAKARERRRKWRRVAIALEVIRQSGLTLEILRERILMQPVSKDQIMVETTPNNPSCGYGLIESLINSQLADNRKRNQEIDNLDTTVTPKIIYPSSPSSEELAMVHAGLVYRKVVTAEELEEEYPSK